MRRAALAGLVFAACATSRPAATPEAYAGRTPAQLLADGQAAFARRPARGAVEQSLSLFEAALRVEPSGTPAAVAAVRSAAWLLEHHAPADSRAALAARAVDATDLCGRKLDPKFRCDYWRAIALGLRIREQPVRAVNGLPEMIATLRAAIAADEELDGAGPHRVLAQVYLHAPSWPLGPGDAEEALTEAQRACDVARDDPRNQLVLAETLAANKRKDDARTAASRALSLARDRAAKGDPDATDEIARATALLAP